MPNTIGHHDCDRGADGDHDGNHAPPQATPEGKYKLIVATGGDIVLVPTSLVAGTNAMSASCPLPPPTKDKHLAAFADHVR